jgi:hypothetical protein
VAVALGNAPMLGEIAGTPEAPVGVGIAPGMAARAGGKSMSDALIVAQNASRPMLMPSISHRAGAPMAANGPEVSGGAVGVVLLGVPLLGVADPDPLGRGALMR